MTGDGPRAIFADAIGWLRERDVLLPGVTTLARLVARARAEGDERLWETLAAVPTLHQARVLDGLLDVAEESRFSDLERWRKGPADPTGKSLRLALRRVAEIHELGIDGAVVRALVPAQTAGGSRAVWDGGEGASGCAGIPRRVVSRRCWRRLCICRPRRSMIALSCLTC